MEESAFWTEGLQSWSSSPLASYVGPGATKTKYSWGSSMTFAAGIGRRKGKMLGQPYTDIVAPQTAVAGVEPDVCSEKQ